MSRQFSLSNQLFPVALLAPAADAAGRTGAYKPIAGASKVFVVYHVNQGNAATVTLAPMQATSVGGAGAKAISTAKIYANLNAASADGLVQQADAASFVTDAGVHDKLVVFELDPADAFDVNNGFNCIAAQTGASNAANITAAELMACLPYPGYSEQGQD